MLGHFRPKRLAKRFLSQDRRRHITSDPAPTNRSTAVPGSGTLPKASKNMPVPEPVVFRVTFT
jgi:hypothetical protein